MAVMIASPIGSVQLLSCAPVIPPDWYCGTGGWRRLRVTNRAAIRLHVTTAGGTTMGDKGGKKDKEKNKQQQLTKHKQEEQKKHDRAPAKKPVAGAA
jgi:hypothetical protein